MTELIYAAIDTETTGLNPAIDRIRSIGIATGTIAYGVVNRMGCIVDNDGQQSSPESMAIHGIPNKVAGEISQKTALQLLATMTAGHTIIIHNKDFDAAFLRKSYQREQLEEPEFIRNPTLIIDTIEIAREQYPGQKYNLDSLCRKLNICPEIMKNRHIRHDSQDDAILCFELWRQLSGNRKIDLTTTQRHQPQTPTKNWSHQTIDW